jgi:hypothetical protein
MVSGRTSFLPLATSPSMAAGVTGWMGEWRRVPVPLHAGGLVDLDIQNVSVVPLLLLPSFPSIFFPK